MFVTLVVILYISGNTTIFFSTPATDSIRTTTLSVVTTEYIKPLKSETCPNKMRINVSVTVSQKINYIS